jgi:phosphocarrier protein FPr
MRQLDLTLRNPTGLHARPAKVFVNTAKQFESKIRVQHGEKTVNAKSAISILTLGVGYGGQICVTAEGPDEEAAIEVLRTAVESGLGEEVTRRPEPEPEPVREPEPAPPAEPVPAEEGALRGIAGAPGIAIGRLFQYRQSEIVIEDASSTPAQERKDLLSAIETAQNELEALHEEMVQRVGEGEAEIFEAHLALLDDPEMVKAALDRIEDGYAAARAWHEVTEAQAEELAGLQSELLAARAADVRDVARRVLRILAGAEERRPRLPDDPVVLAAKDLSPSDTVSLDLNRVLGFCTAAGGPNSHTAILARALGLPAIVGAGSDVLALSNGVQVILDGASGQLTVDPDAEALDAAREAQRRRSMRRAEALKAARQPAITQDGHRMEIVANIGGVAESVQAVERGAEGVGLLRTEFLFLERSSAPTEDEQFEAYRDIAQALDGRPVIVRTLDIGGDKPIPYLPLPYEENPFLGERGIRLCLNRPELLRTQLRALLRASEHGFLRVMFPMMADLDELRRAKALVEEMRAELGVPPIEVGIMIEVPSAALLAEIFAREVDFFSIGTNDLTQYTMAMDRTHPTLARQADGLHPAVLRLVDRTVRGAHAADKWVGVCGELAADPQAVPILVGLGVDELSVNVPAVPVVKAQVRSLTFSEVQKLAEKALSCGTAHEVRELSASATGV